MATIEPSVPMPIAQLGQPVLRRKADLVPDELFNTPELLRLIDQMKVTLKSSGGVGLAAPQVFVTSRVFLAMTNPGDSDDAPLVEAFINPALTPLTEEKESSWEGCLSFLELNVLVPRFRAVRIDYSTPHGDKKSLELHDFAARVVQHENDHLDGILTIDRAASTLDIVKTSEIEAVLASRRKRTFKVVPKT